jgi:hypothetical protein
MKVTLDANPNDAPCCVKLVAPNGTSALFQTDWDWPSLARLFGWSTNHRHRKSTLEYTDEENTPCVGSDATDGTIDCPTCGKSAGTFIAEAREYLDEKDGEEVEIDDGIYSFV